MIPQLEEKVREKVDDEYKEQITFQAERDLFVRFVPCDSLACHP
jgi:hypothetical protein